MNPGLLTVSFTATDPGHLADFWAGLLDRSAVTDVEAVRVPGDGTQLSLGFARGARKTQARNPIHLHLTSNDLDDQQRTVARVLELGGRHLDVGQRPEEGHIVLADPEGNEFCVIEPGNDYLAGTGFLGELTCDGAPEVGHFWSKALGWPLVWEEALQTAIQSPAGGTKLAWDGAWNDAEVATGRHRFELFVDGDREAEAERLLSLGATRRVLGDGTTALVDPGGTPIDIRS